MGDRRGRAPLWGEMNTYDMWDRREVKWTTKGESQGYRSIHAILASNFGAIDVNLKENGGCEIWIRPWKDEIGNAVGIKRLVWKGNLRSVKPQEEQYALGL